MKVLVLTKYDKLGASGRVRFFQYFNKLENDKLSFTISPFFNDKDLDKFYKKGKRNIIKTILSYIKRFWIVINSSNYDLVFIEKEIFPYLPAFFENILIKINKNYIIDYDDAIYLNYDYSSSKIIKYFLKNKLLTLIQNATLITVGNNYLFEYFYQHNKNIHILYSVVDDSLYKPEYTSSNRNIVIGWIGSPSTYKYLKSIENLLIDLTSKFPIKVVIIGANDKDNEIFEYKKWSLINEIADINEFDIGIMPLFDNDWEKGKCGFKLLQYMACGKPVIASPIGINVDIVTSDVGFLANNIYEWEIAFIRLIKDIDLRLKLGFNARKRIEEYFSFSNNLYFYNKLLQKYNEK